jgi:hypothetical protein
MVARSSNVVNQKSCFCPHGCREWWFKVDTFYGKLQPNNTAGRRRPMQWIKRLKRLFRQRRRKQNATIINIKVFKGIG